MDRADRATWAKRLERWKDSGLSAKEFAAEIGVTPKALAWWKWRLGSKGPAKALPKRRSESAKAALSPMTFIEMAPRLVREPLEVVARSGVCIRVPADADPSVLARVLDVLEKRG